MVHEATSDAFSQRIAITNMLITRIITQATTIEGIIDAYIADFYTRCPQGNYQDPYLSFIFDVLYEQSMSLHTKVQILFKIHIRLHGAAVSKQTKKLFENWLSIRNKVAHGKSIDGSILYKGELYDVEELAENHAEAQRNILIALTPFEQLQGPYFSQLPVKR